MISSLRLSCLPLVGALALVACGPSTVSVTGSGGSSGGNRDGGTSSGSGGGTGTGGTAGTGGDPGTGGGAACTGLCAQVASCPSGGDTTLSGTVYDPAGKVPLYNAAVFIPNTTLDPIVNGASCDRCDGALSGEPITHALTDSHGRFTLTGVPSGSAIPLVIQIGKWRRVSTIPTVTACTANTITDKNLTRLPKNRVEGSIPHIAITTGGADTLECLPRRMGLDDSEFGPAGSAAPIHLYKGEPTSAATYGAQATLAFASTLNGGASLTSATQLWDTVDHLKKYDLVLLSCEGDEFTQDKPASARDALDAYTKLGGRVFATHWHEYFFRQGPAPWPSAGTWVDPNTSSYYNDDTPMSADLNTSFPKGQGLAEWLVNVGASSTSGRLQVAQVRYNLSSINATYGQDWMRVKNFAQGEAKPDALLYASFNAPLGVAEANQCGRAVYSGLHVAAGAPTGVAVDDAGYGYPFPQGCRLRDLTPQEKALEFMLFDLSMCVQSDSKPPQIN